MANEHQMALWNAMNEAIRDYLESGGVVITGWVLTYEGMVPGKDGDVDYRIGYREHEDASPAAALGMAQIAHDMLRERVRASI